VVALIVAALMAQESRPSDPVKLQGVVSSPSQRPVKGLDVGIRFTDLGGSLDGDEDWSDFFDAGVGLEVGYEYLHPVSRIVHIGGYFKTGLDRFSGDKADLSDEFGPFFLTADDMTLFRFTLGARIRETFKSFFMDQSIGVGFVTYSDVDGEFSDGIDSLNASIIEGGTEFTFELAARFGFILAPQASVWISFGYENNGAPDVASDVDDGTLDYENQKNFVFTVGGSFDF
jgi:hypothetical protein